VKKATQSVAQRNADCICPYLPFFRVLAEPADLMLLLFATGF